MTPAAARKHKRDLSAKRMKRTRERHREHAWVLDVTVDNLFGDALVAAGRLPSQDESNRVKIRDAAGILLKDWTEATLRKVARNSTDSANVPSSTCEDRPVETTPPGRRNVG
jgi:hypothetical protein